MMWPWPQARPGAGEPASGKTRSARSAQSVKLKDWLALRRHTRRERAQCQQMQMERQQQQMKDVMNGLLAQIRGIQALGGAFAAPPAAALAPPAPAAGAHGGFRPPLWLPY